MKFMVIVKATADSEAGVMPSAEMLEKMGAFNAELVKAGLMVDGTGLKPSSYGARLRFDGDKRTVIDGPFAETKELIAGFWILEAGSLEEVLGWMKRCPPPHPEPTEIEIRPFFEMSDFENLPQGLTPEEQKERFGSTY